MTVLQIVLQPVPDEEAQGNADQAHDYLAGLLPPETYYAAHLNLIRLGREICHARKPDCQRCPLQELCDYYANLNNNPDQKV